MQSAYWNRHLVVKANVTKQNDATDAWNSLEAFEAAGIAKDIPAVQKSIDHKETLRYAGAIVAAELAAMDANTAAFST